MAKIGGSSIVDDTPPYNIDDSNKGGITSRELNINVTPEYGVETGRLMDVPTELSNGGDSSNPLDYAASLPFRGLGVAGQALGAGLKVGADVIGASPIGFVASQKVGDTSVGDVVGNIGKVFLDILAKPGEVVQDIGARLRVMSANGTLPPDIQAMVDSNASMDSIVEYMRKTGRSFANDRGVNLGLALLLDPLNLTPFALGKANLLRGLGHLGTAGTGIAIGGLAGPVGAVAGGLSGYAVGGRVGQKLAEIGWQAGARKISTASGLDLASKARTIQAAEAAGLAIPEQLNKGRYLLYNEIDKAIFKPMRGVADGVKEGLKLKTGQVMLQFYSANAIDKAAEAAEAVAGPEAAKLTLRRFAIAKVNSVIQSVSRSKFGEIEESVDNVVENLDADVRVAIQEYKDAKLGGTNELYERIQIEKSTDYGPGQVGTTDYIIARLKDKAGNNGFEGMYQMNEAEIISFLQDSAAGIGQRIDPGTGLRIVDQTSTVQAAKNRLRNRLLSARASNELVGYDPTEQAVNMANTSMDRINSGLGEEISVEVLRQSEYLGISNAADGSRSAAASKRSYLVAERMVTELINSASDDVGRTAGRVEATPAQIQTYAEKYFEGARVQGEKLVGGKYFDEDGMLKGKLNISRELAQKHAYLSATLYGHNINRLGNVRRVMHLASLFEKASVREQAIYAKEISKLLGHPVSVREIQQVVPQLEKLGVGSVSEVARPTFVKETSLIDTKVEQWLEMYDNLTAREPLVASQYPDINQSVIARLNEEMAKGAKNEETVARLWATNVAAVFDDVAAQMPGYKLGSGTVSSQMVHDFLMSAKTNSATTVRATPKELAAIRGAWAAIGGNPSEIDGIIATAKRDGYELGIAPADNIIREPRRIATVEKAGLAVPEVSYVERPFIDVTSDFVDGLPDLSTPGAYKVGGMKGAIQAMASGVPQSLISSSVAQRLQLVMRDRFNVEEITEFYRRLNSKSVQKRVGQRGLSKEEYEDIMGGILQEQTGAVSAKVAWEERIQALKAAGIRAPDLHGDVIKAFKSEYKQSGYSQWITSSLKTAPQIGKHLAWISENIYPQLKYKINPMFFAQELIESPFYAEMRGMNKKNMEKTLEAAGISAREVRQMFGERTAAQAFNMHEQAFFSYTARSRGAAESALKDGLIENTATGSTSKIDGVMQVIDGNLWDKVATLKEEYRDLMAAFDLAPKFQAFAQKNMPGEYIALYNKYGGDAFDQMIGWMSDYKRIQSAKFGGAGVNTLKAPGFGFAINPSSSALVVILGELSDAIASHGPDKFGALIQSGVRPRVVMSTFRARFVNAAQDAGYDVSAIRQSLDELDNAAQRYAIELNRTGPNLKTTRNGYDKALKSFGVQMRGLTSQLQLADVHKAIVLELMDAYIPGFSKTADANRIIEALGNSRKYGAKFSTMSALVEQIRMDTGDMSVLSAGSRDAIRQTVRRYSNFSGERGAVVRSTQDILTDTTSSLLRDHSGQEALFEAAKWSYVNAIQEMNNVNYFKTNRSFFERSINHPFLGLYPFSYMFGKALPELARFMLHKPFGAIAPGAGYAAYRKIADYISYNGLPPGWESTQEKPDWQFLLVQLIPAMPTDMTVVTPHWFRSAVSTISRQGYDQYHATDLIGEGVDWASRTGLAGTAQLVGSAFGELSGGAADFLTGKFNSDLGTFRK